MNISVIKELSLVDLFVNNLIICYAILKAVSENWTSQKNCENLTDVSETH